MSLAVAQDAPSPVEAFRRDGYVVIPGLFAPEALNAVKREIVQTFHLRAAALGLDLPHDIDQESLSALMCGLFRKDIPSYIAAAKLTQHLVSLHRMAVSPELVSAVATAAGVASPVISTRPVVHYMADALTIPGGYHKTPPHQDWRSTQGSLDSVTIWTPLYDVGLGDYPLEVIPGSHRRALLPTTPHLGSQQQVEEGLVDPSAFEPLPMRAGDAVIFSGFLIHRTGERGGEQVRVAFSFRFNNLTGPGFAERNYPSPYIYRPEPAILTPGFAGETDVAGMLGD